MKIISQYHTGSPYSDHTWVVLSEEDAKQHDWCPVVIGGGSFFCRNCGRVKTEENERSYCKKREPLLRG